MCFIFSLFPATFLTVVGFFILFASSKSDGNIKIFGLILAIWIFIVALLFPIGGAFVTLSGQCPMIEMMQSMEMPMEQY